MRPIAIGAIVGAVVAALVVIGDNQARNQTWGHTGWTLLEVVPVMILLGMFLGWMREEMQ